MINPETQQSSIVAIYDTHAEAEGAIKALHQAGIDMRHLSIVGRDFHTEEHAVGFYTADDRVKFWGQRGAVWGSLLGMLFGSAFLFIPPFGAVIAMGPIVTAIVGAFEGAAIGATAGALSAALSASGIPAESVVRYDIEVKAGKFLLLARGPVAMTEHARTILGTTGASIVAIHPSLETWENEGGSASKSSATTQPSKA